MARRDRKGKRSKRSSRKSSRSGKRRFQKDKLMNRMKKSQQEAEGGRGVIKQSADVTLWRPKDGPHIIDIVPYEVGKYNVDGDEPGEVHYTFRYFVHTRVGPANAWVICPLKTWGKDCPICEERQRLIDKGADWDKIIKPLFPRERYIYNIVCYDRGQERKGVQIWDVSNHYFQKHIITLSKKPARGGRSEKNILFFDEEEGKSISFTIEPPQSKEDYAEYVGHAFEEREDPITDEILDSAHCLDEIVVILSYDEIAKMSAGRSGTTKVDGSDDHQPGVDYDDLLDELDDIDDYDDLVDFCEDNDIDVRLRKGKRHMDKNLDKVRDIVEDLKEDYNMGEGGDGDEPDITADDIDDMSKRELRKLIKEEDLDVKPKDYDDLDDMKDAVIEELGLD